MEISSDKNLGNNRLSLRIRAVMCLVLVFVLVVSSGIISSEATETKISKTKKTLTAGDTYQLKLKHASGHVIWSSSKKSVATVDSKGMVTALKSGKATISARNGGKLYKCVVKVKKAVNQEYTILCIDDMGNPVKGVSVTVCDDSTCSMIKSDEKGRIIFSGKSSEYTVHLLETVKGYKACVNELKTNRGKTEYSMTFVKE